MIATLASSTVPPAPSSVGAATQRAGAPPSPEAVFKKLDSGGKGYLVADDLQSAIVAISPQGAQLSAQDAAAAAKAEISRMDGDQDGQVNAQEFVQAGPPDAAPGAAAAEGASTGQPPAAGARPPRGGEGGGARGGSGGGGGGGSGGGAAGASSSTSYEPADANRDGKVTQPEQQAYDQKHPQQAEAARRYSGVAEAA